MTRKASNPHNGKDNRIGRHIDVYEADEETGKRKSSHKNDIKISYDKNKPFMRDIKKRDDN
jgi:hypothetical protein